MRGENPQGSRFGQALGIETACDESSYRSMPYFQFIPQRGKAGGIIPAAFPFAAFKSFYGALGQAGKNRDCFIKKRSFLSVPKKWKAA